jgi:XTP/dITP diphosphohydrolase
MVPQRILAATGNKNKLLELQTIAVDFDCRIVSPADWQRENSLPPIPEVDENEPTFHGNALLKAQAFCAWGGIPALGDDSGLEVDALNRRPGVHSARYAGPGADDQQRMRKVLEELRAAQRQDASLTRSARFRCALALVFPDGRQCEAEGSLEGHILEEPRGSKGFGYDPIVFLDAIGCTLAEVEFDYTCEHGFRALAARSLFHKLSAG